MLRTSMSKVKLGKFPSSSVLIFYQSVNSARKQYSTRENMGDYRISAQ